MSDQLSIFAGSLVEQVTAPTPGRVRSGGPVTSRQAAERVSLRSGSHKTRILLELASRGERGATPHELWDTTGGAFPHVCATRCHDLRDLGLVEMTTERRPTPTGGESHVWRINADGHRVALELQEPNHAA